MGGIGRFSDELQNRLTNTKFSKMVDSPTSMVSILALSLRMLGAGNRLFILPGYIPPLFSWSPYIFTIHDLNHLDRPENSSFLKRVFYNFVIKPRCSKAKKIFTVSEFSRQRIIQWSHVDADKVINIGNGVSSNYNQFVEPYKPGFVYLLCVGNRKLHKNEARLISAFGSADISKKINLIFTGLPSVELVEMCEKFNITDRVHFLGNVSESKLPSLYKGALALIFPSLYEGFGLPVVEAMACGIPVLTSNTTSLPEVAGDAAILVNPESVDDIKAGIEKLVSDQMLREDLIAKGLERAKFFSWDGVAARVQAVLDEVVERHAK